MKKSIFAKYFTMCATFVLVSITFLGAVLMIFASQYFKDEKYRLLQANAEKALAATYSTVGVYHRIQFLFNRQKRENAFLLGRFFLQSHNLYDSGENFKYCR